MVEVIKCNSCLDLYRVRSVEKEKRIGRNKTGCYLYTKSKKGDIVRWSEMFF